MSTLLYISRYATAAVGPLFSETKNIFQLQMMNNASSSHETPPQDYGCQLFIPGRLRKSFGVNAMPNVPCTRQTKSWNSHVRC